MSILNSFLKELLTTAIENDKNEFEHNAEFYFNGKEYDLSNSEDVAEVHSLINEFKTNEFAKIFFTEEDINTMVEEVNKYIDDTYYILNTPEEDDEDDATYIAKAYLEDTIEAWENAPEDQKERAIKVIADFYNWLEEHSEDVEE